MKNLLFPNHSELEPLYEFVKPNLSAGDIDYQIVYRFIVIDVQHVSATFNQDLYEEPRCAFVSINKAMIVHHAVQQRG
jgi:hypothetical protein